MESVIRGVIVYLFLLLVFRLAGKRTLSETSAFDLIMLLIISETIQQAIVDGDHSLTNAALLVITLVSVDILLSYLKQWFPRLQPVLEGTALIVMRNGSPIKDRMERERIDESEILEAARSQVGIEDLKQVKLAVLERDGQISVIPK